MFVVVRKYIKWNCAVYDMRDSPPTTNYIAQPMVEFFGASDERHIAEKQLEMILKPSRDYINKVREVAFYAELLSIVDKFAIDFRPDPFYRAEMMDQFSIEEVEFLC